MRVRRRALVEGDYWCVIPSGDWLQGDLIVVLGRLGENEILCHYAERLRVPVAGPDLSRLRENRGAPSYL